MSGIVLSASVRQNLLSLQSTAALLATTQNDLATGNKVNSALDNPTNYFTAQGLNNRASDISNLLDGIGNGVQVLQAANTGITSLQSLVASAQSIANQVLQTPTGYSTKSNVDVHRHCRRHCEQPARHRATNNTVTGSAVLNDNTGHARSRSPLRTQLVGTAGASSDDLATAITNGSSLVDRRQDHHLQHRADHGRQPMASGNVTIGIGTGSTATVQTVLDRDRRHHRCRHDRLDRHAHGSLVLSTGTTQNLVDRAQARANALAALGLAAGTTNVDSAGAERPDARRSRPPATAPRPTSPSAPAPAKFRRSTSSIRRWRPTTCRPASTRPA